MGGTCPRREGSERHRAMRLSHLARIYPVAVTEEIEDGAIGSSSVSPRSTGPLLYEVRVMLHGRRCDRLDYRRGHR
jgi:hypothetical protein